MTFKRVTCRFCKGHGYVVKVDPVLHMPKSYDCPRCYGTGFDGSAEAISKGMGNED